MIFTRIMAIAVMLTCTTATAMAQDQYSIRICSSTSSSGNTVGETLILKVPEGATVTKRRDADYADYAIGIGAKSHRAWLEGIYGPSATSGEVPENWLSASVEVVRKSWQCGNLVGVDVKGKLANGNRWRYIGLPGESVKYYDVTLDAAAFFDIVLDGVCVREWR